MIIWGSITLAQSLIKANLIDEYYLQICPAALGGGRLLMPDLENYKHLELISVKKYDTGVVCLHYKI